MIRTIEGEILYMNKNSYSNPFNGINAAQLNDQDILDYWCDPFPFKLFSDVKESDIYKDPNNIVLMGGRSTGKTMFLRYWSFPVQLKIAEKIKNETGQSILDYFKKKGGIGFYLRIDGPILRSFQGFGFGDEVWNSIFTHYFELMLGQIYLEIIKLLIDFEEIDNSEINNLFIPEMSKLLEDNSIHNFDQLLYSINERIREVDIYRGNVPFYNNEFKPKKGFASQSLSFGIPNLLTKSVKNFNQQIRFIVFIDEYENFLENQQRVVNTMLKFSKDHIKFRLGMRLEGFRTFNMISEDDFIKEGREYRKVILEEVAGKEKGYTKFLLEVSRKRLSTVKQFNDVGKLDISNFLKKTENLEEEAFELVSNNPNKHFEYFKQLLDPHSIDLLRYPQNPLLELLNIIWVLRGNKPENIQKAMLGYLQKDYKTAIVKKYRMDYIKKYKLSLMFLLCSIYRRNKKYYSFNTFSFLSSGIVGHFIELCRRAFQYAEFEKTDISIDKFIITQEQQTKAALDYSDSELQQIVRIQDYGGNIYKLINNLGNIFRDFQKDEKIRYPETNQFSVDYNMISMLEFKESFKAAIRWSAIQRKSKIQQIGPGKHLKDIYTLNRIFSPSFQITYRTRGGYSVQLHARDIIALMTKDIINTKQFIPSSSANIKGNSMNLFGEE